MRPAQTTLEYFASENPQLRRPIRQRQAQPRNIGIAGQQFRLDGRNLAQALFDSCGRLPSFQGDLVERPAIAVEGGGSAGVILVSPNDTVGVFRIELH
jgi:hypothetical protein